MTAFLIVSIVLLAVYTVLFIVYTVGWHRQQSTLLPDSYEPATSISIIIPARNEAQRIGECLSTIVVQQYPAHLFEVIVVDDFSEDDTVAVAKTFEPRLPLTVIRLEDVIAERENINAYKKLALKTGIESSKGELIITTDADCRSSPVWLKLLAYKYEQEQSHTIIAPVAFSPIKGVCALFQSLDFMTMQGITGAAHELKLGNMANGANFAFSRLAWNAVDGYTGSEGHASGDDYHLLNKIRVQFPGKISYLKSQQAIVTTPPQEGWTTFLQQRIRWASKSGKYPDSSLTAVLLFIYLLNCCMMAWLVILCVMPSFWEVVVVFFGAKIAAELCLLIPVSRFFAKRNELWVFPLLQPLHILYIVVAGFLGMVGQYSWKGRKVT